MKTPQSNADKATARPWKLVKQRTHVTIERADGRVVAKILKCNGPDVDSEQEAALIVTAVNEHEALRAVEVAARKCTESINSTGSELSKALSTLAVIRGAK